MTPDIKQTINHLRATANIELQNYTGTPQNFNHRDDALILNGYTAALDAIERELGLTQT